MVSERYQFFLILQYLKQQQLFYSLFQAKPVLQTIKHLTHTVSTDLVAGHIGWPEQELIKHLNPHYKYCPTQHPQSVYSIY